MPNNINTQINGLAPFPVGVNPNNITVLPNRNNNQSLILQAIGKKRYGLLDASVHTYNPITGQEIHTENINPFDAFPALTGFIGKLQEKTLWFTILGLLGGLVLVFIAVQGFVKMELKG